MSETANFLHILEKIVLGKVYQSPVNFKLSCANTSTVNSNPNRGLRPPNLKNKITMKNKKNKALKFKQVRINYGDYTKLVLVVDKEAK